MEFYFFSVIDSFKWFWVGSLHKNMQFMLEFLKVPFLVQHFLLYINDLPDDAIFNIDIYTDDTTLYSNYIQASDLWQQLELASELEYDLRDTVNLCRKQLFGFNAGKTQQVLLDWSNNTGAIDMKADKSIHENHLLRCWGCLFLLNWIGAFSLSLLFQNI